MELRGKYVTDEKGQYYMWNPDYAKYVLLKKEFWPGNIPPEKEPDPVPSRYDLLLEAE